MIGHDHIPANAIVLLADDVEPSVDLRIKISDGKEWKPIGASKCAEVELIAFIFDRLH